LHFGVGGGKPLKWFDRLELIQIPYPQVLNTGARIKKRLKNVKKIIAFLIFPRI
jgi:hypothetical protein